MLQKSWYSIMYLASTAVILLSILVNLLLKELYIGLQYFVERIMLKKKKNISYCFKLLIKLWLIILYNDDYCMQNTEWYMFPVYKYTRNFGEKTLMPAIAVRDYNINYVYNILYITERKRHKYILYRTNADGVNFFHTLTRTHVSCYW